MRHAAGRSRILRRARGQTRSRSLLQLNEPIFGWQYVSSRENVSKLDVLFAGNNPGNIGYLEFYNFMDEELAADTVAAGTGAKATALKSSGPGKATSSC